MRSRNCDRMTSAMRIFAILFFLLQFVGIQQVHSDTLTIDYTFSAPEISEIAIDGIKYHVPFMPDCPNSGKYGEPKLPACGAEIAIPYGQQVETIEVVTGERILVQNNIVIAPSAGAVPISMDETKRKMPQPNPVIYRSHKPFPKARFENVGVQSFRGYNILILKLNPLEYLPSDSSLYYFPTLQIIVTTENSDEIHALFRGLPGDEREVRRQVKNPEITSTYATGQKNMEGNYDLLILTLPEFVDGFQKLKDYHDSTGIPTEIRTSSDIFAETGGLTPEHIREYITNRYLYDGIEYVLLGDDDNVIAAKYLYVEAWVYDQYNYVDEKMPGDLYYACLDGTWDYDGDGRYGEPTDGEGGGDVDLIAEVYVGRAAVDDTLDVSRFVNKTIAYLSSSDPYLREILFTGEQLGYPDMKAYGSTMLEELVDGTGSNGYETVGIPSDLYSIDRLYDRDWPGGYWPTQEVIDRINSEKHFINHLGHCFYTYALKMYTSQIPLLTNSKPSFMYVQGCYAGGFDTLDTECWAEVVTVKTEAGAFAGIFNARYGWVESYAHVNTSDGAGQRLHREFWDAIFNPDEGISEIGRANQDSKEDNLYRINDCAMRWTYYQVNLFGDPTVPIKRFTGLAFDYPEGIPEFADPLQPTQVRMQVSGLYGGTPVDSSGQVYYSINGGEFSMIDMVEISPGLYEADLPAITRTDAIQFYFGAEEGQSGRLYDPPPDSPFVLIPRTEAIVVFADDFEIDKGWSLSGDWERGLPAGNGGEKGWPDPSEGCAGPAVLGYNLNGDYDNSIPSLYAISPAVDCSGLDNVHLSFDRWLGVEQIPWDNASISVSTDGADWTTIWSNAGIVQDSGWKKIQFDISDIAAFQSTVYLRWTMGPCNHIWHYCGWNIDDVRVSSYYCQTYICGDANGDQSINIADAVFLINYIFKGGDAPDPPEAGDANCDGAANVGDAVTLIDYIFKGGPEPCRP